MLRRLCAVLLLMLPLTSVRALGAELTGSQIIAKVDENAYFETSHMIAEMIIRQGRREMRKEMEAWGQGNTGGLVVFLNAADRGTKYLKLNDELWMFFPHADDLVKISGHMLNQGMMGSDFSYADAMESNKLTKSYSFTVVGEEFIDERACYVIEGIALPDAKVSYPKRKSWVDKDRFVVLQEELYAASGKLLKIATTEEVRQIGDRYVTTQITMRNLLKRNSSTTMIVKDLEINIPIPEGLLSLRSLMR